jgi:hypothetical protein
MAGGYLGSATTWKRYRYLVWTYRAGPTALASCNKNSSAWAAGVQRSWCDVGRGKMLERLGLVLLGCIIAFAFAPFFYTMADVISRYLHAG